jgi:hypothetical protein
MTIIKKVVDEIKLYAVCIIPIKITDVKCSDIYDFLSYFKDIDNSHNSFNNALINLNIDELSVKDGSRYSKFILNLNNLVIETMVNDNKTDNNYKQILIRKLRLYNKIIEYINTLLYKNYNALIIGNQYCVLINNIINYLENNRSNSFNYNYLHIFNSGYQDLKEEAEIDEQFKVIINKIRP